MSHPPARLRSGPEVRIPVLPIPMPFRPPQICVYVVSRFLLVFFKRLLRIAPSFPFPLCMSFAYAERFWSPRPILSSGLLFAVIKKFFWTQCPSHAVPRLSPPFPPSRSLNTARVLGASAAPFRTLAVPSFPTKRVIPPFPIFSLFVIDPLRYPSSQFFEHAIIASTLHLLS